MTRVEAWFRRKRLDQELDKELQFHLDQHVRDLVAAGVSADDAKRLARIEIGGVDQVKERVRDSRSGAWLDRLRCDARNALRGLRRTPGVALTAIALIALVIGGNTTIFSMVHGILTKPARGVQASRLVTLQSRVNGRPPDPNHSYPDYLEYVSNSTTVRSLFAYEFKRFTLSLPGGSFAFRGGLVTSNYFDTLGVHLVRGRSFTEGEYRLDASGLAAVVSYQVWQDQFHGTDDVIGHSVLLNGHPATVIGVAPPQFQGAWLADRSQVWVPLLAYARLTGQEHALSDRSDSRILVIGQLAAGVSLSAAQAEFRSISSRLEAVYPDTNRAKAVALVPYSVTAGGNSIVAQQGSAFLAIFSVITMLTVVIVCANVANLMLARAAVRQRETAVRRALGASRLGIVRALLIEGLVISLAAWLAACLFALWTSRVIVRLFPPAAQGSALPLDFTPDWVVVTYAMLLALLATVAFTLPPALRAWRQDVLPWLKAGEQGVIQGRCSNACGSACVRRQACGPSRTRGRYRVCRDSSGGRIPSRPTPSRTQRDMGERGRSRVVARARFVADRRPRGGRRRRQGGSNGDDQSGPGRRALARPVSGRTHLAAQVRTTSGSRGGSAQRVVQRLWPADATELRLLVAAPRAGSNRRDDVLHPILRHARHHRPGHSSCTAGRRRPPSHRLDADAGH